LTEPFASKELRIGRHLVRVTVAEVSGAHEVVGVEVWGMTPPAAERWTRWESRLEGVTPVGGRSLRIPVTQVARALLAEIQGRWAPLIARTLPERVPEVAPARKGRGGRPPYGAEHWAGVAAVVMAAEEAGRSPMAAVREQFLIAPRTAARWVRYVSTWRETR
jgi:hypothetical protein